ncbi:MAG: hypothetical protein K8R23_05130 [Chthoniobacter sp.]|nr:hypothetical protein [Chthoniobacter sp.]
MKTITLSLGFLSFAFGTVAFAADIPAVAQLPGQPERDEIYIEYRKLKAARTDIQTSSTDQEARKQHVAALQDLFQRAKKIDDSLAAYSIHTELNHFGIVIPKTVRWRINDQQTVEPKVLTDAKTRITYYLESDGRHVSAIAPDGKILWHRDPFNDAKLWPYRVSKPVITYFKFAEKAAKPAIAINFNSSQFGTLDLTTGSFQYEGQD